MILLFRASKMTHQVAQFDAAQEVGIMQPDVNFGRRQSKARHAGIDLHNGRQGATGRKGRTAPTCHLLQTV